MKSYSELLKSGEITMHDYMCVEYFNAKKRKDQVLLCLRYKEELFDDKKYNETDLKNELNGLNRIIDFLDEKTNNSN